MTGKMLLGPDNPDALIDSDTKVDQDIQHRKSLLRLITCGSVDDGKSTLIGRMLYDAGAIYEDQLIELEADSKRLGTRLGNLDFALLVDGLSAEREQGITIDVAYRFFSSEQRKFIIADTPGHEQYTRNMVTAASTADLAIVLVDARKGVLAQTRRHTYLAHLIGVRNILLAVNKMDAVAYDQSTYDLVVADYAAFAERVGITDFTAIPIAGLIGDNVHSRSHSMPWFGGPTLMDHLDSVSVDADEDQSKPFRLPVQWVNRGSGEFRGFAGQIAAGRLSPGQKVRILPSGATSTVARIVTRNGDLQIAVAGQSITVTLDDEIDCSRGDVIASADAPPQIADQFEANLVWLADEEMLPGRSYLLKTTTQTATVQLQAPKYVVNVNTLEHLAARTLAMNAIGVANLSVDRPIVFDRYADSRVLGSFILIDKVSNATLAAGMLNFALRRAQNIHWQTTDTPRALRAALKHQKPCVLWMTGLSSAGKSTIANLVEKKLVRLNRHTFLLDGDNVRHGLSRDLGFTDADRVENIRRVGEVARLMTDAGLIVIAAFISPFSAERDMVRRMMEPGEFFEIHVDTTLAEAEKRDTKGLYAKARAGQLPHFTGLDSPYEAPESPEVRIDTSILSAEDAAELIVDTVLKAQAD